MRAALALLLGLGSALAVHAQSLQELYQAAQGYDAGYLAARASFDAAQYRYDQARGLRLPQVGLGISAGRQMSSTPDSPSTKVANTNSATATLTASQTLFNRANDVTIMQSEKAVDAYRSDLQAAEQDLILRVTQA